MNFSHDTLILLFPFTVKTKKTKVKKKKAEEEEIKQHTAYRLATGWSAEKHWFRVSIGCRDSYVSRNHRNLRTKMFIMSSNLWSWQERICSLKDILYSFIQSNFKWQSNEASTVLFQKAGLFIV